MTKGLELQPAQCGSTALGTCQPRHMVVSGCYQVFQAQQWGDKSRVAAVRAKSATSKQWAPAASGKQARGKHRSFQAIAAQKEQLSIQSRTSQSNLSLPQTLPSPCWVPKGLSWFNPAGTKPHAATCSAPPPPRMGKVRELVSWDKDNLIGKAKAAEIFF